MSIVVTGATTSMLYADTATTLADAVADALR